MNRSTGIGAHGLGLFHVKQNAPTAHGDWSIVRLHLKPSTTSGVYSHFPSSTGGDGRPTLYPGTTSRYSTFARGSSVRKDIRDIKMHGDSREQTLGICRGSAHLLLPALWDLEFQPWPPRIPKEVRKRGRTP